MDLRDELTLLCENAKRDTKELYEKAKLHPLMSLFFIFAVVSLIAIPHYQVSKINDPTEKVKEENEDRTTLAQIFGGLIAGIGLLYGIFMTVENLKISNHNKITENFTRAVDQLGAIYQSGEPAVEIRLGGIYALEGISIESDEFYWSIIELLIAYIGKNSSTDRRLKENAVPLQKIWLFYKTSEKHHKWGIYMP